MGKLINLVDRQFERLKVLDLYGRTKYGKITWLCECDCGRYGAFSGNKLTLGETRSCGCLKLETISSHKMSKTKEYISWTGIKSRCYNEKDTGFYLYGLKGIKMSKDWYFSFEKFYEDMGPKPGSEYSIERIDYNGDYCKENCKWATNFEQSRNKSSNVFLIYNGEEKCLTDWAKELSCSIYAIDDRLKKGEPFESIYKKFIVRKELGEYFCRD